MIVFDLKCTPHDHPFEAWFGSSSDYEDQRSRGLLTCPLCGSADIEKALMAPAIPAKSNSRKSKPDQQIVMTQGPQAIEATKARAILEQLAKAQSEALKDSQWVGRKFADVARAMHYGEQDHSSVHGEVAPDEAKALIEEGVPVAPLPFPVVPPTEQN
ncbi:DUF1178 domain-containing protein [Sphingobium sp. SCG-1]|uniref:DUF1178 family protein n=1 Tax=Sphingobium sp. SCG-1 TaxID=2072936 RepID=UPI000CD6A022|nr:DUF1178 family protein [Sphingobium sp. SCG-1]AUW58859.1 DUF1178 domain-containing protein [Sphingobium sp. SCG-1]